MSSTAATKKTKKVVAENINARLALVMKSGKVALGYKSAIKTVRQGKGMLFVSPCFVYSRPSSPMLYVSPLAASSAFVYCLKSNQPNTARIRIIWKTHARATPQPSSSSSRPTPPASQVGGRVLCHALQDWRPPVLWHYVSLCLFKTGPPDLSRKTIRQH